MIKPKRLRSGSRIAIISPSSGLPYLFPDIYELGLKQLQEVFGWEVVEMPSARMSPDESYRNPQLRAQDINDCFENEEIDGIVTSIGGYESVRILPFLNTEVILKNPKFIMGFSDATTFLTYLNNLGMVTFYGPSVMAGFAQLRNLPEAFTGHLNAILVEEQFPYHFKPYQAWTNGYKDWSQLETLGECLPFSENQNGWTFIQGEAMEQGYLWGGCIEVLEFMKSTAYWPKDDFWQDKILIFETSEEKPSPMQVGYMLRNYGMQGIFSRVKGVILGRAKDYSAAENVELREILLNIIGKEFGAGHVPIVVDFDFGHTDPKLILPLGGRVQLNPRMNEVILLESPFE
ncbi:LD-carboxypeptidase [Paenibacillus qinlingensis]|uniref:Muramoyltetrapeptide carboxypeptidase LdcA involved in peptidoglycan recycling n=1 Tax=Paenibacillus qinlingensis TaxID=1837343 RepID=A0ABU1P7B4_9BACL|nr:LD-carboxypeptidase [Paenibacillus qinlingensis]MDR6555626.1 muramoyltetrapeptide carboxypeptidase LdcA involved in peptidoglycan recycling [Paenibacillus qinlingensis]